MEPSPTIFVGREPELATVQSQVLAKSFNIVFITGAAGIGKTKLLEKCAAHCHQNHQPATNLFFLPIIDFYDTNNHSEIEILKVIADALTEQLAQSFFAEFNSSLLEFYEGRKNEQAIWQLFSQGYLKASQDKKIILRFDTAELLVYEKDSEDVLKDCEPEGLEAPALGWFKKYGSQLPNTTILIAGRNVPELSQKLQEDFGGQLYSIELTGLSQAEVFAYFDATRAFEPGILNEIPDLIKKMELLTEGRPIRLALAINWLNWGVWDRDIYLSSVNELIDLKNNHSDQWQELTHKFERLLVETIRELKSPLDMAFKYAARARKGFSTELMQMLMQDSITAVEFESTLERMKSSPLVKIPHIRSKWRPEWFYLHDELYDLVESYVWEVDFPGFEEQVKIAEKILVYYDRQINLAEEKMKTARSNEERSGLVQQKNNLQTERLYYAFEFDPQKGQYEYDRLEMLAINRRAIAWENALRIEALRFLRQRAKRAQMGGLVQIKNGKVEFAEFINRDCRARWVYRFGARNRFEKAITIGQKLLDNYPKWPELWQLRVQISLNSSRTRQGQLGDYWLLDEAEKELNNTIRRIKSYPNGKEEKWLLDFLEATAYIHLGFINRSKGELTAAEKNYQLAIEKYEIIKDKPGQARALNNLSYIYARQGRTPEALISCKKALDQRKEAGDERGVGLSLNTLAAIKIFQADEEGAILDSKQAANIFSRFHDNMGGALANINLGRIHRRLGLKNLRRSPEEVRTLFFSKALYFLENAEKFKDILEPFYIASLYNEKGCTYKDWANYHALHHGKPEEYRRLMDLAEVNFSNAHQIAHEKIPMVAADNLEDWAWIYHLRYAYFESMQETCTREELVSKVEDKLHQSEKLLEKYKDVNQPGIEAHFYLGKIYFQRALFNFKFLPRDSQKISSYFATSCAFFETFSADVTELKEVLATIDRWLDKKDIQQKEANEIAEQIGVQLILKHEAGWQVEKSLAWINDVVKFMLQQRVEVV